MRAILWKKYGNAEALELGEVTQPEPKSDELLIKVKAFTVNRTDAAMLQSSMLIMRLLTGLFKPKLPIIGTDFAGEVVAKGDNVKRFDLGDRLFGFDDSGLQSHAEYLVVRENNALAKIPEKVDFETASASLEGPHYAENFLNKVNFKEGQTVFVHGGTGGIGSALVKLVKLRGGIVMASGRGEHLELLKARGADNVIDYTEASFWQHQEQYDYVFDSVGKGTFGKFKPFLKTKGIYISSELGPGAQNLFLALIAPIIGGKKVRFPIPLNKQYSVDMMANLLAENKYQPLVDRTYAFNQTPEAFAYVLEGLKVGNVIIKVD